MTYDLGEIPVNTGPATGEDSLSKFLRANPGYQPGTPTNRVPEGQDSLSTFLAGKGPDYQPGQSQPTPEQIQAIVSMLLSGGG